MNLQPKRKQSVLKKLAKLMALTSYLVICSFSRTHAQGVNFEKGLSWVQIKTKAKTENKHIFVDCYATWCGPCKYMADSVLSLKDVGDYMNDKFISVAVQMDKTWKDNAFTRSWYNDASELLKEYTLSSYPTYLIFSPDGIAIHKIEGSMDAKSFVKKVSDAFLPKEQYYTLRKIFYKSVVEHFKDSVFLKIASDSARLSRHFDDVSFIASYFLKSVNDPLAADNLRTIEWALKLTNNKDVFDFILANHVKISLVEKSDEIDGWIRYRIIGENILPLADHSTKSVNWEKVYKQLKDKYPEFAERIITEGKPMYYSKSKNYDEYGRTEIYCLNKYFDFLKPFGINLELWNIFEVCQDKIVLKSAAICGKKLIEKETQNGGEAVSNDVDTYANLLYKSGDTKDAIFWEQKAMDINIKQAAKLHKKPGEDYPITLAKMQKGQKTWD